MRRASTRVGALTRCSRGEKLLPQEVKEEGEGVWSPAHRAAQQVRTWGGRQGVPVIDAEVWKKCPTSLSLGPPFSGQSLPLAIRGLSQNEAKHVSGLLAESRAVKYRAGGGGEGTGNRTRITAHIPTVQSGNALKQT